MNGRVINGVLHYSKGKLKNKGLVEDEEWKPYTAEMLTGMLVSSWGLYDLKCKEVQELDELLDDCLDDNDD